MNNKTFVKSMVIKLSGETFRFTHHSSSQNNAHGKWVNSTNTYSYRCKFVTMCVAENRDLNRSLIIYYLSYYNIIIVRMTVKNMMYAPILSYT